MRHILIVLLLGATCLARAQEPIPASEQEVTPNSAPTQPELVLYPNPTSTMLRVRSGTRSLVRMPVEVRALDGQLLILDDLGPQHELDVSHLEEGYYRLLLMDLQGVRGQAVFKVVR